MRQRFVQGSGYVEGKAGVPQLGEGCWHGSRLSGTPSRVGAWQEEETVGMAQGSAEPRPGFRL